MNLLARGIDARDDQRRQQDETDDLWLRERAGVDPAERRELWRRWVRRTLEETLQWPENPAARERLIGQCVAEITSLARQLRGRGWLLEGKALAEHVRALLTPIAAAQRKGAIGDFWPYFRAAVGRYVGAHAEEIQAHARRTGAEEGAQTMAGALAALGLTRAAARGPSITELLSDRDAEIRAAKAAKATVDTSQLPLFAKRADS